MMNLTEAAQKTGIPQQTLTRWIQYGLVRPEGWKNKPLCPVPITRKELREFRIIRRLRQQGVPMSKLIKAADYLRSLGYNPFSRGNFVVMDKGKELVRIMNGKEAMALIRQRGQLILIAMEEQNGEKAP